jgi:hypothetical protein
MHKQGDVQYWKWIAYGFSFFVLLITFSAYYAPDMMIAMTNQVWALCGW